MIIKTNFEAFDTAMTTVSNIVGDKNLQEDLKNLVIWVKEGTVRFAAYNGNIVGATKVEAEVTLDGDPMQEQMVQLKAKDINDVLTTFKGLKRTKVSSVQLNIRENEAILEVTEDPVDEDMSNASEYHQVSKFRIVKPVLKNIVRNEIQKINMDVEGVQLDSEVILLYINTLLPTVLKETRESTNQIMFSDDLVYTVLGAYSSMMPNKLPEQFRGFRLQNSVVNFVKNFISADTTFTFHKQDMGNGGVMLTLKVNDSVAVIKCFDMSRAFDMTNYTSIPANGIIVDKAYLIDVLKRMSLSSDAAFVEVAIENGVGTMRVLSKNMTQSIPVISAKGEGVFSFSIRPELLSNAIFSHAVQFDENVFLYLEMPERNIVMACTDNSQLWSTKLTGLSPARGDFAWT